LTCIRVSDPVTCFCFKTGSSTSIEDSEESVCSEVDTESVGSSGTGEAEFSRPDSSVNAVQNVKPEEIIVTPNLEILSDDSIQSQLTDEDEGEVPDSNSKTLPDDMNDFIARFQKAMHDRSKHC
jgi:hypothetical protein